MAILHFRYKERRRTVRVPLTVPLTVHLENESGEKVSVRGQAMSVSRHGGLLTMSEVAVVGQMLMLVNENSNRRIESRVVSVRHDREGKTYVAVEFVTPDTNFWHMTFPAPGTKPLRRSISSKVVSA